MKTNKNNQGRWCMIRDTKTGHRNLVEAIIVDSGVRIQTGEHFGEKRVRGEYEVLELINPKEADETIGVLMAE